MIFLAHKHTHDIKDLENRLSRIEGHIRGIKNMVSKEEKCEDILIQIGAVKAALNKVGEIILESHLESCVVDGIENGNAEETIKEFKEALQKFMKVM